MILGFIGAGVVGGATIKLAESFGHETLVYDPPRGVRDPLLLAEAIFVSVPVPTKSNGRQDLTILKTALEICPENVPIFIRSSVVPGTCDKLCNLFSNIKFNIHALPEFLTERTAHVDSLSLPIVATERGSWYLSRIFPEKKLLIVGGNKEAEMVKYVHNCFAAMKVGFFNSIYQACENENIKYERVVDAACGVTGFIEKTHTQVPGPDGKFGFGGRCLPKDLLAFVNYFTRSTGQDTFLKQVLDENFYNRFDGSSL